MTRGVSIAAALLVLSCAPLARSEQPAAPRGKAVYDYYCYQCHGYAGDARTLARTFLEPAPRDFTAADPATLTRAAMLAAVREGRTGTAMSGFAGVLDEADIAAVVGYVRDRFMRGDRAPYRYHTKANGWPAHERYAAAFPFATGERTLDTPWEQLDETARRGRRLYMRACVSCHDHGAPRQSASARWELRALSYPRRHYDHRAPDALSGASPYAVHERAPVLPDLSAAQRRGAALFQQNCAFCHAADGSGRNWIGSFLEPRPRDLSAARVRRLEQARLVAVIRDGLPGTSMPAWGKVLGERQLRDVAAYLRRLAAPRAGGRAQAMGAAPGH